MFIYWYLAAQGWIAALDHRNWSSM